MSALDFFGGLAGGIDAGLKRGIERKDKEDFAALGLENQIKAMNERAAVDERMYETRKASEKATRKQENLETFGALGMTTEQAQTMTMLSPEIQNLAIQKHVANPEVEWEDYFTVAESTGEDIGNLIGGKSYTFNFRKPQKTFKDAQAMSDDNQVKMILEMQKPERDEDAILLLQKNQDEIDAILLKGVTPKSPFAKANIYRVAGSTKNFSKLSNYGEFNADGTIKQRLEAKIRGEAFQYAEAYDGFQKSFDTKMSPYADIGEVMALQESHKVELQQHVNSSIADVIANDGQQTEGDRTSGTKVVRITQAVGQNLNKSLFENTNANKNDVIELTVMTPDGGKIIKQFLWGGTLGSSYDQTNRKWKYKGEQY